MYQDRSAGNRSLSQCLDRESYFPVYELRGTPSEIGRQHGLLLRDKIHETYKFYLGVISKLANVTEADIQQYVLPFMESIRKHLPNCAAEIEAIAEASGMEQYQIYTLNCRTELFRTLKTKGANECTVLAFPRSGILGETWDWSKDLEKLGVVLKVTREDGHKILMMTEPGIIGKVGFNSAGLGVALNILSCPGEYDGIPIHILLRVVLDSKSLQEAMDAINMLPSNTTSNMLLLDQDGQYVDIEFASKSRFVLTPDEVEVKGCPLHANDYRQKRQSLGVADDVESLARHCRASQLITELPPVCGVREMMKCLTDPEIAKDWHIEPDYVSLGEVGTVCAIVMDLPKMTMHITSGNPHHAEFKTICLH